MSDNNGNSVFLQRSFHPERLRRETELQAVSLWLSVWGGSWRDRCRRDRGAWKDTPPTACCRLFSLALRWAGWETLSRSPGASVSPFVG